MRARTWILMLSGALVAVGCADLLGFKDLREPMSDAQAPDGSTDGNTNSCPGSVVWPAEGTMVDPGSSGQYSVALRHVYFSTTSDGGAANFGYNIDGKCTTNAATASCLSSMLTTDAPGGVDNESITLMSTLVGAYQPTTNVLSDQSINAAIGTGYFTMVLTLFNFRGVVEQPSSTGLNIALQSSPGTKNAATPNFDGTDIWEVATDDSASSSSSYPLVTHDAYITGGLLVSSFQGRIGLRVLLPPGSLTGPFTLTLSNPTITAKVVKNQNDAGYDIASGLIVGRWAVSDILSSIASLTLNDAGLCDSASGVVYSIVKTRVCPSVDINAGGSDDNTSPCDAISVAFAFDGVAAQVDGTPKPFPTSATPCSYDAGGGCDTD